MFPCSSEVLGHVDHQVMHCNYNHSQRYETITLLICFTDVLPIRHILLHRQEALVIIVQLESKVSK